MDLKELNEGTREKARMLQSDIYEATISYIQDNLTIDENKIKFNNKNINIVDRLTKYLTDKMKFKIDHFKEYILNGIKTILGETSSGYQSIDPRAIQSSNAVQKEVIKHAATTVENMADLTAKYAEIKGRMVSMMSNFDGVSLWQMREDLNKTLIEKASIEKYFSRWTHDIYVQYDRIGENQLRKKLGLTFAMYVGGEIETSREFCIERNGEVFHESEIMKWVDLEWQGKPESGYNPIIDCGGYNCRHKLRWISKELAARKRPEVRTLFSFEFVK